MSPASISTPRRSARLAARAAVVTAAAWRSQREWNDAIHAANYAVSVEDAIKEWREIQKSKAAPAAAPAPAPAPAAPLAVPALRRSTRLAAKQYQASYRKTLDSLSWYANQIERETVREEKIWRVNNYLCYSISRLTGPSAVPSFIQALQSSRTARDVWMNKCLDLIREVSVNPGKQQGENIRLLRHCETVLEILETMNFHALAQQQQPAK